MSATGLLSRASSGLLALIGGLPAVAVVAAGAIGYIVTRETDLEQQTDKVVEATRQLNAAMNAGIQPATDEAQAQYELSLKLQAQTKARLDALLALQKQSVGVAQGQFAVNQYAEEIGQLSKQEQDAAIKSAALAGAILKVKLAAAGKSIWETMFPDFHADLSSIEAAQAGIDKQIASAKKLAATYGDGRAAVAKYDEQQALDAAAAKYSGEQLEAVNKAIKEQYAPLIAAEAAVDKVMNAHKGLGAAAKTAAAGLQELQALVTKLDGEIGGPGGKAWADYVKTVDTLDQAYAKALKST